MNKFTAQLDAESLIKDSRDGVNKINKKNVICVVGTSLVVLLGVSASIYFTYNSMVEDQSVIVHNEVSTELSMTTKQLIQESSTTSGVPQLINPQNPFSSHRNYKLFDFFTSPKLKPRIMNGQMANLNEYPWQVAIICQKLDNKTIIRYNCGGSLISDRLVLTAAHCIPKVLIKM